MILAIISIFIIIALFQVPSLIKRQMWRELAAFLVLLAIGFILSILQAIGVEIPSPNQGTIFLVENLTKIFK